MKKSIISLGILLCLGNTWAQKVVVLSPDVADIVVAIGASGQVIGKDSNSQHHKSLSQAKNIGVYRSLSAEPIVALKPTVVLGSWMVQPPSLYQNLNKLGIQAINVSPKETGEDYVAGIRRIGQLTGKSGAANQLASQWQQQMKTLPATQKRYLLSYDGRMVAGKNTVGDYLIRQAGGINAAGNIDGMKPMSREAWLSAKPDVIIVASHNLTALGGLAAYQQQPEIKSSPAAKNKKVLAWPAKDFLRLGLNSHQVVKKLNTLAK